MKIVWDHMGMGGYSILQAVEDLGWKEGVYRADYDLWAVQNHFDVDGSKHTTTFIFTSLTRGDIDADSPLGTLAALHNQTGRRPWVLCPYLFQELGSTTKWSTTFAQLVIRPILQNIMIRRTITIEELLFSRYWTAALLILYRGGVHEPLRRDKLPTDRNELVKELIRPPSNV
ncbi:unnamed protein product [Clonostachys byssicola]|uniref:Uncharacterized protein n=1 Tax=Clonostachys byssicola TaxID=160290 RepID=A0A9N9UCK0_9HYPO|nr:unnamed protein product [Clonostachys byssicola]